MIADLSRKAQHIFSENSSAILTAGGVAGTIGTAILAGRASFKAADLIEDHNAEQAHVVEPHDLSTAEKVKMTWPLFIPPVGLGVATVASIVMANRLSAKRAAALAAAYGISERNFQEYKEKALEKLGVNKEQKLRDEVAQDRISKDKSSEVIILSSGDVLCYDMLTGRYFQSSVEKIKKAETMIHNEILHHMYASFSDFCQEVGLPPTDYTEEVGWNSNCIPEVTLSTTLTPDDRPCIAISFNNVPRPDYGQVY